MRLSRYLLAGALAFAATTAWAVKTGDVITVRVISAKLMQNPKFIGPVAANVSRGDFLTYQEAKGDWYRVKTTNGAAVEGWINRTNVENKKVKLSPNPGGGGSGGASQDEVELAGRGFTPEVEGEYRKQHPDLDFSHVDGIEKSGVDPMALQGFVSAGGLGGGE